MGMRPAVDGYRRFEAQVPEGWELVRLGDVLVMDQPGAWGDEPTLDNPGVMVLRAANLTRDGRIDLTKVAHRRLTDLDLKRRLMRDGDVLLERSGGGPGTPVGRVALVNGLGDVYCNNFCQHLRLDTSLCYPQYAVRVLWHWYCQGVTARLEQQTTGIRNLDYPGYLAHSMLLPPLHEQRAIAAVLDSIDAAIERTEAVIAATEQLRGSLLHELLTRGVPGWHTEWKDVPGLGTIPADWDVVRLGDVLASTTYGTNVSLDGNGSIPVLRMNNLQNGAVDLSDLRWTTVPDENLRDLDLVPGDILFNRTNSLDLVGKVAVVRELPQPITFASYLVRLRANDALLNPYWLGALLSSQDWQSRIQRFATPAVSQANINPTSLKTLALPLPLLPEQQAMTEVLDGVDKAIGLAYEERECMQAFQASAADALLTGQVRILEDRAVENG